MNEHVATVIDTATGYRIEIKRVELPSHDIEYVMSVSYPLASVQAGKRIDSVSSVGLHSDGSGPMLDSIY